jgi:hypothetical protein
MRLAPPLNTAGMWPAQIRAVENLEASFRDGKPRALVQMATGSGKTFTAISSHLPAGEGGRRAAGAVPGGPRQPRASGAERSSRPTRSPTTGGSSPSCTTSPTSPTTDRPGEQGGHHHHPAPLQHPQGRGAFDDELRRARRSLATARRSCASRPRDLQPSLPPEFFDVVVVDECHRSIYTLWRQVIEYFDASLVGPHRHAREAHLRLLQQERRQRVPPRARRARPVNVPYQVYELRTRVTEEGGTIIAEPDTVVGKRDRSHPQRALGGARRGRDLHGAAGRPQRGGARPDPHGAPRPQGAHVHRDLPRPQRRSPRRSSSRSPTTTPRTSCASSARSGRSPTRRPSRSPTSPSAKRATPRARAPRTSPKSSSRRSATATTRAWRSPWT